MANFFAELKRRNIYRVGAVYAVVAWVLLQLAANVSPILDLPPWVARTVLLLLVIGFPVALVFAWVQQLAPESGGLARVSTGKLDWFIAAALVLVIALVSYEQLAPSRGLGVTKSELDGVATARAASATQSGAVSIAVLPFANLSSDLEQEFFSDGMTEEITSVLARIPDLRVVARTSAGQFKGEKKDLRAVGQALGATHLIEGSVRKDGNRLRITAQLIESDNGVHLWTESYDRELTDVFAVQEDIATAIAGALRMPLGLKPGQRLIANRSIAPESYQQYLHAKALIRTRGIKSLTDAAALLEQVVAGNPDYAPAWAALGQAYGQAPFYNPAARYGPFDELQRFAAANFSKADAAAQRAIQLDPDLADGYLALGLVQGAHGPILVTEELWSKALSLDPTNPEALELNGHLLAGVGRLKESLAAFQRLQELEPFVPAFNVYAAVIRWEAGQTDAAIAVLKQAKGAGTARDLARIYAATGQYGEAADLLHANPGPAPPAMLAEAERLLRMAPAKVASPQSLPRLEVFGFVYLHVGAENRVLEWYESNIGAGARNFYDISMMWHPSYAAVRKTQRYNAFMLKAGYVDYWRVKGWPEFCHPTTGDDFECD